MIKLTAAAVIALALGGVSEGAHAQSTAQWSQLVAYVSKLANRMLDQQIEIERLRAVDALHRETINITIGALDNERCRTSRTLAAIRDATAAEPTKPILTVENVACVDLKSPPPPFPQVLPAPQ
jgi:hypothetical protein